MADVAWTENVNNAYDRYPITAEATIDNTNQDTEVLQLDPRKETTFALQGTADTYTVDVIVYLENVNNTTPQTYTFASGVSTSAGVDYIKSSIGPVTGIKFNANAPQAGESVVIQVLQVEKRVDA
jgi:hypothetical protein